ncbi:hypothetical protein FKM82_023916 [Ascaphus truei]
MYPVEWTTPLHPSVNSLSKMLQSHEGSMDAKTPAVTHINPKLKKTQEIGIKRKNAKTPAVTHSPERKTPQEMGIKRKQNSNSKQVVKTSFFSFKQALACGTDNNPKSLKRKMCQTSLGAQHISQASLITQGAVQLAANEKSEPPLMYPTQPARKLSHLPKLHIEVQSNKELYVPVWKRGGLKDMEKRSSEVKAPSHMAQKIRNNVLSSVKTKCPSKSEGVPKCSTVETKKIKILSSAAKDQVPQTALQKKVKPMSKPVNHSSAPIPGKSPHGPQSGDEAVLLKKMKHVCLSGAHISYKVSEKMLQSREGTMDAKTPAVTHINPKLKKTQEIGIKRKNAKTPAVNHSPERKTPQEMGIKRKQNSNSKQVVKTSFFSFEQALACGTDNNPKALKRKSANQPGMNSEVLGKGKKSLEPSEQGNLKAHPSNLSLLMINAVQLFHPLGKKAGPTGPGAPAGSITLGNKLGSMQGTESCSDMH